MHHDGIHCAFDIGNQTLGWNKAGMYAQLHALFAIGLHPLGDAQELDAIAQLFCVLDVLRGHCDAVGRDYDSIVKTWAAESIAVAETEVEAKQILDASPYKSNGSVGTPVQVAEQLQRFVDVGVEYFSVRVVDFPRTKGLELFAREVVPLLQSKYAQPNSSRWAKADPNRHHLRQVE